MGDGRPIALALVAAIVAKMFAHIWEAAQAQPDDRFDVFEGEE